MTLGIEGERQRVKKKGETEVCKRSIEAVEQVERRETHRGAEMGKN